MDKTSIVVVSKRGPIQFLEGIIELIGITYRDDIIRATELRYASGNVYIYKDGDARKIITLLCRRFDLEIEGS